MSKPNISADSIQNPSYSHDYTLDTTGLICPEPVMLLHKKTRQAAAGETINIIATDPATTRDIPNFCRHLGHVLLNESITNADDKTIYQYLIQKKQP